MFSRFYHHFKIPVGTHVYRNRTTTVGYNLPERGVPWSCRDESYTQSTNRMDVSEKYYTPCVQMTICNSFNWTNVCKDMIVDYPLLGKISPRFLSTSHFLVVPWHPLIRCIVHCNYMISVCKHEFIMNIVKILFIWRWTTLDIKRSLKISEWVVAAQLQVRSNFSAIPWWEQVTFRWDYNNVRFVVY